MDPSLSRSVAASARSSIRQSIWIPSGRVSRAPGSRTDNSATTTKVLGRHELKFGVQINKIDFTHARADKVVGSITSLVALIDGDQLNLSIPAVNQPAVC